MHITVLLGLSVLLVVSLTVSGFSVQEDDEDEEMMLSGREVQQFDDAESIYFMTEAQREIQAEGDEEEMTLRVAASAVGTIPAGYVTPAQLAKVNAYCQKNPAKCAKAKAACIANPAGCKAKAAAACKKYKGAKKPAICAQLST